MSHTKTFKQYLLENYDFEEPALPEAVKFAFWVVKNIPVEEVEHLTEEGLMEEYQRWSQKNGAEDRFMKSRRLRDEARRRIDSDVLGSDEHLSLD